MADMTRRTLLTLGGAAGLLALAGPAEAAAATTNAARLGATTAKIGPRSSFTHLVGRTVTATGRAGSYRLTLIGIGDVDRTPAGSANSFNLIFRQQSAGAFIEGIYRLSGPNLKGVSLLLNSVGADGRIQALINRGN